MRGHYEPDDQAYVDRRELAAWAEQDPIHRATARLLDRQLLTLDDVSKMQARVDATVQRATAFAEASPFPSVDQLTTQVYA